MSHPLIREIHLTPTAKKEKSGEGKSNEKKAEQRLRTIWPDGRLGTDPTVEKSTLLLSYLPPIFMAVCSCLGLAAEVIRALVVVPTATTARDCVCVCACAWVGGMEVSVSWGRVGKVACSCTPLMWRCCCARECALKVRKTKQLRGEEERGRGGGGGGGGGWVGVFF